MASYISCGKTNCYLRLLNAFPTFLAAPSRRPIPCLQHRSLWLRRGRREYLYIVPIENVPDSFTKRPSDFANTPRVISLYHGRSSEACTIILQDEPQQNSALMPRLTWLVLSFSDTRLLISHDRSIAPSVTFLFNGSTH